MTKHPKNHEKSLFLLRELSNQDQEIDLFEEIFYQFPDMIQSVDDNGRIVAFNKKACDLLGYSEEELSGKSVFDIYAPEVREELRLGFEDLKVKGLKEGIQSKLATRTGDLIDVEIRSLSLYDAQGRFMRTLSILRDMRELNVLKRSLLQQSKLAAIGELSSGIMHDIRNPLSIIFSYNEMIKQAIEAQDWERVKKCEHKIQKASERIERLTNHLQDFVRSEADHPTTFLLKDLLEESLMMVEARIARAGVTLTNQLAKSPITIIGRPNRLEQVFINLISNACDACAEKGLDGKIHISAEKQADRAIIRIKDNGSGIKAENLKTIFEAFFTTKPKGSGTGLGLSISKGIINDQGGLIAVTSEPHQGAEFTVQIPLDIDHPLKTKTP